MRRLLSERSVCYWSALLSVAALLLAQTSAMAADVTDLFQEARTTATQLNRDAAMMESYTRSNLSWQTHSAQRVCDIKVGTCSVSFFAAKFLAYVYVRIGSGYPMEECPMPESLAELEQQRQ